MTARPWKPIEVYDVFRYGEHYLKYNFRGESKREYRWRIKARNGKIIAASSEGFSSRAKCLANLRLTCSTLVCAMPLDESIRDLTARKPK